MAQIIRIMIAEDHALFGQGLRRVLDMEPDLQVVAEVADGDSAVERALELVPDVILMDINMPKRNGIQAMQNIKSVHDEIKVIILTAYDDEEQLFFAMRAGASAYYPKDVMPEELLQTIRTAHKGGYVVEGKTLREQDLFHWILKRYDELAVYGDGPDTTLMPLSPREMEILEHIARGSSNKEIAFALGISRQTVKNHMSNILRKLSVGDRTQAAIVALRRGWIRLQDTKEFPEE